MFPCVVEVAELTKRIAGIEIQRRVEREDGNVDSGLLEFGVGQSICDRERSQIPLEFVAGTALPMGQGVRDGKSRDRRVLVELFPEPGESPRCFLAGQCLCQSYTLQQRVDHRRQYRRTLRRDYTSRCPVAGQPRCRARADTKPSKGGT